MRFRLPTASAATNQLRGTWTLAQATTDRLTAGLQSAGLQGAHVDTLEFVPATGEFVTVTLSHEAPHKVASAGYRRRLEHLVPLLLGGRWTLSWDLHHDRVRIAPAGYAEFVSRFSATAAQGGQPSQGTR